MPDSAVPALSHVYDKLAFIQMRVGNVDVAMTEKLLNKSLAGRTGFLAMNLLADLYLKTGREADALMLVDGIVGAYDAKASVWSYNTLSRYYAGKGQYEDAYAMLLKRDSAMTVVDKLLDSEMATDLWQRYDAEVVKGFARRKMALIVFLALVVVSAVLLVLVVSGHRLRKKAAVVASLKDDLLKMQIRINNIKDDGEKSVKEKTEELKAVIDEKQAVINGLSGRLSVSRKELDNYSKRLDEIGRGLHYLYDVMRDGNISQQNKAEREAVIECYRVIDVVFVHSVESVSEPKLTVQEKLFCILRNMGKDDVAVKSILGLSDEAYRKTRSRALNKLKSDAKLLGIVDKIK